MSRAEVEGCVAAIVSAFQTAAEAVEAIKARKEKKKRKKEYDFEEIVQAKLLHKSLLESANQCRLTSEARQQQHGPAFGVGDHIATSELKDVVVGIQIDLVQALQMARAVDNAVLDLNYLYEASITNRNDALRTMDELSRRIMSKMASYELPVDQRYSPRQTAYPTEPVARPSTTSIHHEFYGVAVSSQTYARNTMAMSTQSTLGGSNMAIRREIPRPSHRPSGSWSSDQPLRVKGDPKAEPADMYNDSMSEISLQDSAIGSEMRSPTPSDRPRTSSVAGQSSSGSMLEATSPRSHLSHAESCSSQPQPNEDESTANSFEKESLNSRTTSMTASRDAEVDHAARALSAPEVVTKEFESLLLQKSPRPFSGAEKIGTHLTNIHPALRVPYSYVDAPPSPEPENIWEPLTRPAKLNNYHGFCKGAWQIRKSVVEGLSIHLIPNANDINVPYWSCKLCDFRAKATNANALPDQIFFNNRSGIRYRWLFQAKSHVAAVGSFKHSENFAYGCIFCAAEGRTTARYEKLDKLMIHIVAQHKTTMMTPETKEKTRCVVSGQAKREEEWDIDLPETKHRGAGIVMQEFVLSAVTGISNYGQ